MCNTFRFSHLRSPTKTPGCALIFAVVLFFCLSAPVIAEGVDPVTPPDPLTAAQRVFMPMVGQDVTAAPVSSNDADMQYIDGLWSFPRNDIGDYPVTCEYLNNTPEIVTDENQVRYGHPIDVEDPDDCGAPEARSGFGFLGVSSGSHLPGETFLLGQFTHYNERIAPSVVPMDFVDLAVRMRFMGAPSDTVFDLTMRLEETPNNQSVCPYGATNNNECDDRVDFTNNTPQTVVNIDGVDYALEMVGFVPGTIGQCQPSDLVQDFFITAERTRNDACVYARFVEPAPSITIEKTPDLQQIAPGGDIEFSIKVHNTGNVGLAEVNVDDPMAPECSLAIGDLKASVEMSYTCTVYGAYEAYENVATVTGLFAGQTYQASDNAIVEMLAIDLPTVRALKYHDGNGNGVQDLEEPGLPGWEICLADGAGTESCKITDDNGYVELAAPDSGDYQICETLQPGWENTDPSDGSLCKPVTLVRGSNDIELPVTVADVYRIIYEDRSPDNMYWTYRAGQYIGAEPMTQWVLALDPCLDASQIDATWTTPGWTLVDGTEAGGPGLRGIRWETPGGVALEGDVFFLALKTGFPTGATTAGVVSASGGAATAEIAGPVCTAPVAIGNKESAAVTTGLEVRVAVVPTTDPGRFDLQVDGVTLADDVAHGGTTGLQLIAAGTHNIAQLAGADTALEDYVTDVSCQVIGGGTWKPDASGNILIQSGETVVCTYSNIRKGEVVIAKTITGGGVAEAQFTGSFGQFSVAGGSEKRFERLAPGSYNVFETLEPTWWLAALACSDPDNGTATDMANAAVAIDLDPGEVIRCTFENSRESGVITIVKQVTAPADGDWLFNGGALGDFSLPAAGGQRSFTDVPPGVYTIVEAPRANWYVNSLVCTDPDGETTVFGPTGFATVDVDTGEEITCTYVNSPGTPDITLDKSVKQSIQYVGDVAEFTFVVGAKTPVPLNNVIVEDLMCTVAPVLNGRINVGDANTNGWLDMGEQWQYTCSAPLIEDTVNMATATGTTPWGGLVFATDTAQVDVIAPELVVSKEAGQATVYAGQTVTYTIAATNNGDSPLANVVVEESIPECVLTPLSLGDGDAILGPGERWTYACSLTVSADIANTANASGVDLMGKTWTDTAIETVQVVRPHIRIRKSVDKPYIYPGETANFTMIVKNIGNDPLRNVVVTDSMPQCKLSAPVGDNGDGILSPDEEWTYSCAVVFCKNEAPPEIGAQCIEPDVCDDAVNTATVTAKDSQGGTWADQDSVAVDLIRPQIGVTETADKPQFEPGEIVTFFAEVTNTGDTPLWEVSLTPDLAGCQMVLEETLEPGQALQPGEAWHYSCAVPLTEDATNTVLAQGQDIRDRTVQATASTTVVKVSRPNIELRKTVDKPIVYPGETANFKVVVKNTGTVVLRHVRVWDSLEQCKLSGPKGDNGDGKLSPNEEWTYTCAVVFCKKDAPPEVAAQCTSPDLCKDVVNTATVVARTPDSRTVSDQDSVAVDLIRPKLGVTETVDKPRFEAGETVTFKADVKNTGDTALWDVTLTPDLAGCTMVPEQAIQPGQALQPGDTWSYTCGVVLTESATNNVVARGHDERGRWVSATASASAVKIERPAIDLTKTVDKPIIYPGETANFKIVVKNTGTVILRQVQVWDSLEQCKLSAPTGDNGDGKLSPNEEWTYTCAVVFCKNEAPPEVAAQCTAPDVCRDVVNTAKVTAKDSQGQIVSDQDRVAVDLVRLKIGVTETVDKPKFTPGETVTFKADVKNTGELPLWDVTLTPDLAGCTMVLQNAITPGQALQPGETWSYTCGVALTASATNNVVARGHDERGRWVSATASASAVMIVRPAIDLTKTVDKPVIYPGETANFKIVVKNTGGVTLRYVTVTDSLPQCILSAPKGDNGDGKLSPNEEWTYTCAVVFCKNEAPPEVAAQCTEPDLCADAVNTARVTAKDSQGQTVSDQDSVAVDLVRPKIGVTETVDKAQFTPGETVTFKADVKNTGDTALWDVTLTPDLAGCTMMLQNAITPGQALEPGETWSYTCGVALTENATNNVVAKGHDARNREVSATASASSTKIVTSKIFIDKSVDKPIIYPGESVKFTILVKNTGTDVLSYVNVTDSMPQCTLSARVGDNGDGKLSPNEQWTYTCSVVFCKWEAPPALGVLCTAPDVCADTVNSATVTAKDSQGKVWSATDSVAVDLIRPKIGVAGSADKPHFTPGDTITFSAVVTNTGDAPLWNTVALSDLAGCTMALQEAELADQALQPGEVLHFECEVSLTQSVTNKVVAKGFDARNRAWSKVVDVAVVADGVAGQAATDLLSFANHVFMPVTQR